MTATIRLIVAAVASAGLFLNAASFAVAQSPDIPQCQQLPYLPGCPRNLEYRTDPILAGHITTQDNSSVSTDGFTVTGAPSPGSSAAATSGHGGAIPLDGGWTGARGDIVSTTFSIVSANAWSGQLSFEQSFDAGSSWFPAYCGASSTSGDGIFVCSGVGIADDMRVRSTAPMTGSVNVWITFVSKVIPTSNGDFP